MELTMAEQLASVPEETTTGFPPPYPPSSSYLESIRSVDVPEWRIRSSLFTQSGHSGSSYSSNYSSSYSSGCSSVAGASGFGAEDLTKIAQKMISDGYIQQIVQAFSGQNPDSALEAWFVQLDVYWVLQRREIHGSRFQLQPQELVEKWIRSLTLVVLGIKELSTVGQKTPAVARFGKASISAMLDFVHIFNLSVAEKLQVMLLMYTCVSNASFELSTLPLFPSETQSILIEIGDLLEQKENNLIEAITITIVEAELVELFCEVDDTWHVEILRGRGEVHRSVQLLMDCIVSMRKAHASSQHSAQSHNTRKLLDVIADTMGYLKSMLQKISEQCFDPSLRYIFLLNNTSFVAQVSEPSVSLDIELLSVHQKGLELTPECKKHMDSYLEVSWGHVLSCISTSKNSGPLRRWKSTSSLAKFQSAFQKTYQAQKFWKVPDPRLRSLLREAITKRVISAYRDYLKEHPELEKEGTDGSSNPDVLEQMVGELFEG